MADDNEIKVPASISIGKVIGTAGMVIGAVALGIALVSMTGAFSPTTDPESANFISRAASWVGDGVNAFFHKGPEFANPDMTRTLLFAGAVGGAGYLLSSSMQNKKEEIVDRQEEEASLRVRGGGFAANEQTRAIQGLMKARLMAADPSHFAAMGGQGIG